MTYQISDAAFSQLSASAQRHVLRIAFTPPYRPATSGLYIPNDARWEDYYDLIWKPVVNFGGNRIGFVGQTLYFDASGSYGRCGCAIRGASWDFGDGQGAAGITVTHVYNRAGLYRVSCTVTSSDNGLTNVGYRYVKVFPSVNDLGASSYGEIASGLPAG